MCVLCVFPLQGGFKFDYYYYLKSRPKKGAKTTGKQQKLKMKNEN